MSKGLAIEPSGPGNYLSVAQQRLLGGWRDVTDDIKALCRSLAEVPDGCHCGSGEHHLRGTCVCCGGIATEWVPNCNDCETLLARLRPAVDLLRVDTFRFFPVVRELLARETPPELAESGRTIETHIAELIQTFEALVVAADQFRADCRSSHLKTLKALGLSLRRECDVLNRTI